MYKYYAKKILKYVVFIGIPLILLILSFKAKRNSSLTRPVEDTVVDEEVNPFVVDGYKYLEYTKIYGMLPDDVDAEDDGNYYGNPYTVCFDYDSPGYLVFWWANPIKPRFCMLANEDLSEYYYPITLEDSDLYNELVFAPDKPLKKGETYYFLTKFDEDFGQCYMYETTIEAYNESHSPNIEYPREQ